jgi:hypothetical protein
MKFVGEASAVVIVGDGIAGITGGPAKLFMADHCVRSQGNRLWFEDRPEAETVISASKAEGRGRQAMEWVNSVLQYWGEEPVYFEIHGNDILLTYDGMMRIDFKDLDRE